MSTRNLRGSLAAWITDCGHEKISVPPLTARALGLIRHGRAVEAVIHQGGVLLVDPEVLRAFAGEVYAASEGIKGADVGPTAMTSADGLAGSTTQWAMHLVGEHLTKKADAIAKNVEDLGVAVRGAGDRYEVTDSSLAGTFDGLF